MEAFTDRIKNAQIIMIPGGFSGGDEPEGSGKFVYCLLPKSKKLWMPYSNLLQNRDGLMMGICNDFQALIKLGLVHLAGIIEMDHDSSNPDI